MNEDRTFKLTIRFVDKSKNLAPNESGILLFEPTGTSKIYVQNTSEQHCILAHELGHFIGFLYGDKTEDLANIIEDTVRNYFRKRLEGR